MTGIDFLEETISLTKSISKQNKKDNGIFFTPPVCVNEIIKFLDGLGFLKGEILEPSCGSGEFLRCLEGLNVTAVEINSDIHTEVSKKFPFVIEHDFLSWKTDKKFDVVIGNPPYKVIKESQVDISMKYSKNFYTGRPNLFILFIIKCINLLKDKGVLAFVLPVSFTNCIYYDKTRKFIVDNCKVILVKRLVCDYIETKQETCLLVVQKGRECNGDFVTQIHDFTLITDKETKDNLVNFTSYPNLSSLNCEVSVGKIVWNQVKDSLTDNPEDTRIIYSNDIIKGHIGFLEPTKFKNPSKKNWIKGKASTKENVILVNRGYGVGKYNFKWALITDQEFLVENHILCITGDKETLIKVTKSFENPKTQEFIDMYFKNNAINATELKHVLPIIIKKSHM
jgi:hypothetical protein